MKAVLVIDMPTSCYACQLRVSGENCAYDYCSAKNMDLEEDAFPSWCPLKELPKKTNIYPEFENIGDIDARLAYFCGNEDGWNDCIDEITGEWNEKIYTVV